MDALRLDDLATATGGRLVGVDPARSVTRISTDSRTVQSGDVFWALTGQRFDGHDFVAVARQQGAILAVCNAAHADRVAGPRLMVTDTVLALQRLAAWYRARQSALVIGVTGSVGKTTTRQLIHAALSRQFQGIQSAGNFNNHIGLPKSLLSIEAQHEFAVLELGASHVGEIARLAALAQPEVGALTAIGRAHLEGFGGVEGIIQAKGELLEALPANGFAVLPGDDPVIRKMARRAACRVVFVGETGQNDVQATLVAGALGQLSFMVDRQRYVLSLAGRHLLTNALLAVAIAREIGVPPETIAAGLADFTPEAGRCCITQIGPWMVIDDTYNASPTAMTASLELLAQALPATPGRRYAVLGDMLELGKAAASEHRDIGRHAARLRLDGILACGDHAAALAQGAAEVGFFMGRLVSTPRLEVLLAVLDCWLEPGDLVLVKGSRSMQMERVIAWLHDRASALPRRRTA